MVVMMEAEGGGGSRGEGGGAEDGGRTGGEKKLADQDVSPAGWMCHSHPSHASRVDRHRFKGGRGGLWIWHGNISNRDIRGDSLAERPQNERK
jgi:hypothetical protein